jgi:NADPH:quinone reductase-like Zn-dependent oxidoreductase
MLYLPSLKGGLGKQSGERVLINGGSTAVGRFAIQLAKNKGVYVVVICSSRSKESVARLGPDEVCFSSHTHLRLPSLHRHHLTFLLYLPCWLAV